jgi:hypothetical protein
LLSPCKSLISSSPRSLQSLFWAMSYIALLSFPVTEASSVFQNPASSRLSRQYVSNPTSAAYYQDPHPGSQLKVVIQRHGFLSSEEERIGSSKSVMESVIYCKPDREVVLMTNFQARKKVCSSPLVSMVTLMSA